MHASIKTDKKHRNRTPKKETENRMQIEQNKPQSLLIYCTYDKIPHLYHASLLSPLDGGLFHSCLQTNTEMKGGSFTN
jgi:hypothetical protein